MNGFFKKQLSIFLFILMMSLIFSLYFGFAYWNDNLKEEVRIAKAILLKEDSILNGTKEIFQHISAPLLEQVELVDRGVLSKEQFIAGTSELKIHNGTLQSFELDEEPLNETYWKITYFNKTTSEIYATLHAPFLGGSYRAYYSIPLKVNFDPLASLLEANQQAFFITTNFQIHLFSNEPSFSNKDLGLFIFDHYGFPLDFQKAITNNKPTVAILPGNDHIPGIIITFVPAPLYDYGLLFVDFIPNFSTSATYLSFYSLLFFVSLLAFIAFFIGVIILICRRENYK